MASKNNANLGFEKQIWEAAYELWGHIPAADYRKMIVGLIFLRYISAAFERRHQELVAEGEGFGDDRYAYEEVNVFFVPEQARWGTIAQAAHTPEIGIVIDDAMRAIEADNKSLKNVLPKNYASPDLDKRIVEEEQGGADYAKYGQYLLKNLGEQLSTEFGSRYNERRLRDYRAFYQSFKDLEIRHSRLRNLTWSHFRIIMREPTPEGRAWYVREASEQMWSTRTLEWNVTTQYYGRLLASQRAGSGNCRVYGIQARQKIFGIAIGGRFNRESRKVHYGTGARFCVRGSSAAYHDRHRRLLYRSRFLQFQTEAFRHF